MTNNPTVLMMLKNIDKKIDKESEKTDLHGNKIAAIEQHLKDMNGKLINYDLHISKRCPDERDKLNKRINDIKFNLIKLNASIMGAIGVVIIIANYILQNIGNK